MTTPEKRIMDNIFSKMPACSDREDFYELFSAPGVRIERIVSFGHTSPEQGWYDQDENEWVVVLEGCGTIAFDDGRQVVLSTGDCLNIPAHARHRVVRTDPEGPTIWLAVFYG